MQHRPAAQTTFLHQCVQFTRIPVFFVKLLKIMGRTVDEWRTGRCQLGQEERIGPRPAVTHRVFINDFETCRFITNEQEAWRADREQFIIIDDIFPVIPEIFGRKGRAIRPFVTLAQMKGENIALLVNVKCLKNIGLQVQVLVVANQARIAINNRHADILGPAHDGDKFTAIFSDCFAFGTEINDIGMFRKPLQHWRQGALGNRVFEIRDFCLCASWQQAGPDKPHPHHQTTEQTAG